MDIDNINYPAPKQEYKVLVRCATYNQSKYIEDALNGFVMQQTNFPFVCLVMDDASTDGEQDVIKEWMERECDMNKAETIDIPTSVVIIVPHKTNESCTFAFYLLKQNLYGTGDKKMNHVYPWREKCEYEALCEGDDYWIDPLKLQKQVDFLDANPEYGLVHTYAKVFVEQTQKMWKKASGNAHHTFKELLVENAIITNTVCFRKKLYVDYIAENIVNPVWKMGDYPLWLYLAKKSQIHFIPDITGVYRILENSASHSSDIERQLAFYDSDLEISKFFDEKYGENDCARDKCEKVCVNVIREYIKVGESADFRVLKNRYGYRGFCLRLYVLFFASQFRWSRMLCMKRWGI